MKKKRAKRFEGPPAEWSCEDLLFLFTSYPELLASSAPTAGKIRGRLKELLEQERDSRSSDLTAVLAVKVLLLCPQIFELKAREGFEWVAEKIHSILELHALAVGLGVAEPDLAPGSNKFRGPGKRKGDSSLKGYLREAMKARVGNPSELGNDILRVILVKTVEITQGYEKSEAERYIAALEGVQKAEGSELKGKRVQVDIGTTQTPHLVDISRVIDNPMTIPTVESEVFDPNTYAPSEREVDRSFENIKNQGLELVVEGENGTPRIMIVPGAFLPIIRQCREETQRTTETDK
jgi:hypothetical protein